jgi:enamine deaminase RidA (YjgF/YER057c/UK114 family)
MLRALASKKEQFMFKRSVAAVAGLCILAGVAAYARQSGEARRYINPGTGEIGTDANRKVPDTAEAEAKLVLDKVQATLKAAGMTMDDLVSVQIFCSDVRHYDAFNGVYRTYFKKEYPARAFIGAGTLLFGARFEVQGIAVKR